MFRQTVWDRVCATGIRSSRFYLSRMMEACQAVRGTQGIRYRRGVLHRGFSRIYVEFRRIHEGCMPLMDNGHYHPTEYVSDKIPAMLCFYPEFALHITRGRALIRIMLLLDDDERDGKEIVRNDALDRVCMALDYFDASINRVLALATGLRSWQKALLTALCTPNEMLKNCRIRISWENS